MDRHTALRKKSSIPKEIVFEIFSWLPVKSLVRFKCVSKFCNSLISDPYFKEIHQSHSSIYRHDHETCTNFLALSNISQDKFYTIELGQTPKASVFNVKKLDHKYYFSAYAKGLLCLWDPFNFIQPAIILNPSTRETRFLPCLSSVADQEDVKFGNIYCCTLTLGFDADRRRHKVLMTLLYHDRNKPSRNWIFTLGTPGESWRELKSNIPNYNIRQGVLGGGVDIDGVVYFFNNNNNSDYETCILAFNVRTEEFRFISSLWDDHLHWIECFSKYELVEFEGKLAAIDPSRWERGTQGVWILRREEWVYEELILEECCINNGENLVLVHPTLMPNLIFLYDLKKKWWRAIDILGLTENHRVIAIYSYNKESLYSL